MLNADRQHIQAESVASIIEAASEYNASPFADLQLDMSILHSGLYKAPELPIPLFGEQWAQWIERAADSKGCPPDFVAVSLLTAMAGIMGNTRRVQPWDGWIEPIILWGVLVGLPSSGKSPATDVVLEPIYALEQNLAEDFQGRMREHETLKQTASLHHEAWKASVAKAVKEGDGCLGGCRLAAPCWRTPRRFTRQKEQRLRC